jgi:PAS domain S-box-containing protein
LKKTVTYLLFVLFFCSAAVSFGQSQKRILIIDSYDATFHTYVESEKAIHKVFPLKDYHIDIEFLDAKRYPNGELHPSVIERVKIKQKNQLPYDLVIASHDDALNFCLKSQEGLLAETPVIFWGVNDLDNAFKQDQNEWVTGIAENISLDKTLGLIRKLHPDKKNLQVITDNSYTGKADFKVFQETIVKFKELNCKILNSSHYSLNEYAHRLSQISKDEIILLLSSYNLKDEYIGLPKIRELLLRNTKSIIYYAYDKNVGNGYLGGIKVNYYDHMHAACLIAKQVLTGTPVKHLKVIQYPEAQSIVDFKLLKKHQIDLKNVPDNATIINRPIDKLEISKGGLFRLIALMALIFGILFFALYLINASRKLEKSHRILAENYRNIFNENHSIMLLVEAGSQRITDANKAAARFYGYSMGQLKNLQFGDLCQLPQLDIDAFLTQSARQNSHFEQKHQLQDGQVKDVELHSGRIVFGKATYIYAIIHDISKRVVAEMELIFAKRKAEESDRLKSAFLANMSHEIRTPMNSILGFTSLLQENNISDEMRGEFIRHVQNSGDHLLNLINDIIDISKIEANQLKISFNDCNLNQLLDEIYLLFKNQVENSKNNNVRLLLTKGIDKESFVIKTDCVRLKQIFLNLLCNAQKFTDSGSIEFGYKYREDSVVQFFVKDTGIGIPQNMHKQIFSAFQQIEEHASRNHGGTGLGLSITRSLVEKLGGHIWVMSEQGNGARFYFTHPSETDRLDFVAQPGYVQQTT